MTFDDLSNDSFVPSHKVPPGQRRWYDPSFVKKFTESLEKVPPYKRDSVALKIVEIVDSVFKNEINRKVNTNKNMILGMYKEFEKRRWYDRNPNVLKAVKGMCSLVNQRKDLQKMAVAGIIESLGEYYEREKPKVEVRAPEPIVPKPKEEPIIEEAVEEEVQPEEKKKRDSKVMVSGEKLFIKRDKTKLKPKPKNKPSM